MRQLLHQREPLVPDRLELAQARGVGAAARRGEIVKADGIEIIVRQGDESEPEAPQFDHLTNHPIDVALPRLLTVSAPDGTERAVFGTASHGLHRRPHVASARQQVPSRGQEGVSADASAVVQR